MRIIRAVLREYHAATHTAEVEPVMGPASLVGEIPVLMSCRPDLLTAGTRVAVLTWSDVGGLVLGPYGSVPGDPPSADDADKVDGIHATSTPTADKLLALDGDAKLPASITGDADTVDSIHAATTPTANKLLAMDADAKFPSHTVAGDLTLDDDLLMRGDGTSGGEIDGPYSGAIRNWISTYYSGGISVTAANTPIASLSRVSKNQYSGLLVVNAWHRTTTNTGNAAYVLLVCKAPAGSGVVEIAKLGLTTGGGSSWPSFTWSLDTVNNHLEASPVGSTSDTFYFAIQYMGTIRLAAP